MIKKQLNKKAGFWIRLLSQVIDLIIFSLVGISSSLICIEKNFVMGINEYIFGINNLYYIWLAILIIWTCIQYISIPLLLNGRTIGMLITNTKIEFNDEKKIYHSILKRIELGPLLWIVVFLIFFSFIWPSVINKTIITSYIKDNFKNSLDDVNIKNVLLENKLTTLESAFYAIPSTISPIIVIIQLFLLISSGFKNSKVSLLDKFSNSQIVYKNKKIYVEEKIVEIIKPEKNIEYNIIWKN